MAMRLADLACASFTSDIGVGSQQHIPTSEAQQPASTHQQAQVDGDLDGAKHKQKLVPSG
jgi:hypothetical protein